MDLAVLAKKAFLIPTQNQPEQEYLAKHLKSTGLVPYCNEQNFNLHLLNEVKMYKGLIVKKMSLKSDLLSLFKSE